MKKKFLVVLLALTMVFAFSAAALADDVTQQDDKATVRITYCGETVTFDSSTNSRDIYLDEWGDQIQKGIVVIPSSGYELEDGTTSVDITGAQTAQKGRQELTCTISYTLKETGTENTTSYEFTKTLVAYVGDACYQHQIY